MHSLTFARAPLLATLALSLAIGSPRTLHAQRAPVSAPIANVRYEVTADHEALEAGRLGVRTTFDVSDGATVLLSLPAWTPGAYEISNFARNVSDFHAVEEGATLTWDKLDYDTWRVHPTGRGTVTVEFSYAADMLDNAMSWTKPDVALFNGTNLFMYPEGRSLDFAGTVIVRTDPAFTVATSMHGGGASHTYTAPNYHELVDMPFLVGKFDLDSGIVSGKMFRYATYPVGSVKGEARASAWEQLKRIVPVESNVFGVTPWDSYTLIQIADSTSNGYSGLEHAASHVDIVSQQFVGSESQPSLYAHEIFHAWNVKRLRPSDLTPYQYDRAQPTTWLWVSEGITDYYADLAEVRAGIVDAAGFYALTAGKMGEIATTVPFALQDASLNTWIHPKDGTEYSYYPKGSLAGLMLDVAIRDGSDNRRSLDTVLRELYQATYLKGHGFTHDEFWNAVKRAAGGKSFDAFEKNYVDGREPFPWPQVLAQAGLHLVADSVPRIGIATRDDPTGNIHVVTVDAGSMAAQAGVHPGDIIVSVGDVLVSDADFGAKFRVRYMGKAVGTPVTIVVKRGNQPLTLTGALAYAPAAPRIADDPAATPKAVRIRNGILRGTTDR